MSHSKPFTLLKRSQVYYVRFRLPDGSRSTSKSSGQISKARAESWAIEYLKNNRFFIDKRITFAEYARGFFDDTGIYATNKHNSGKRIGLHHLKERRDIMKNHIIPYLGNIYIFDIKYKNLEQYRNDKFKEGYTGSFIVKHLHTINAILKEACKDELIQAPPLLPECSTAVLNPRGCLTVEEVKTLFTKGIWKDYRAFAASLLSASTGLRLGEIQGLVMADLHLPESYLVCRRSYDYRNRCLNETTKNGRSRNIILSSHVVYALQRVISTNPHPLNDESPVFWSDFIPDNPTERNTLIKGLYRALASIGINDNQRRQRNISFHSHRHFLNSLLINAKIPLQKVQSITGHLTAEMSQHYYKLDDMSDILQITESIVTTSNHNTQEIVN